MKMLKIESCHSCKHYKFEWPDYKIPGRFKCYYHKNLRKNGKARIMNRKNVYRGIIPGWCKLEDYPV